MPIRFVPNDRMATRTPIGLRLVWGEHSAPVRRIWKDGLALDAGIGSLPGLVSLLDGERHVATGLICSDEIDGDEHRFHFKRMTFAAESPPLDYATGDTVPAGMLMSPERMRSGL